MSAVKRSLGPEPSLNDFFITLKRDVSSMLQKMGAYQRREDKRSVDLHLVFQHLEILQREFGTERKNRDYAKIRVCWREVVVHGQPYQIFARFKGDKSIRYQLLDFLNP